MLVYELQGFEQYSKNISEETKENGLVEILETFMDKKELNGIDTFYSMLNDVIDRKTTFKDEYDRLGEKQFIHEGHNARLFYGNSDLLKMIEYLDSMIERFYGESCKKIDFSKKTVFTWG